jgi:RNA polymerase sigma-70 factor (ECF subfamily)
LVEIHKQQRNQLEKSSNRLKGYQLQIGDGIVMTFEEIYSEYHKMVFNIALHYVQNIEDAEEIAQDVFVKVFDNLDSFKKRASLKTWIYRISINKSLDFIKAKNTEKRNFLSSVFSINDEKFKFDPANFNHPGIELEQKEAYQKIFRAINQLSDNQKTAIILLKIEDKSQAETAEIMNLNEKALESLFQRAKRNLENLLNTKG